MFICLIVSFCGRSGILFPRLSLCAVIPQLCFDPEDDFAWEASSLECMTRLSQEVSLIHIADPLERKCNFSELKYKIALFSVTLPENCLEKSLHCTITND